LRHDSTPLRSTPPWARLAWLKLSSAGSQVLCPAILVAYGLAHVLMRLLISGGAELDEAEQLLLSQVLAVGYTDQPPLYTWLLLLFQALFGVDILSLALLKNLLLCVTYLCLFLAARVVLNDAYLALLTSLSLWLIPQIAWESHRDLTHSVLVTSLGSGFCYALVKLLQTGQTQHYLMLGLLLGLGTLSKHSFLLFVAALMGAVFTQRDMRGRLLDRRMVLACGLAALVALPHGLWLLEHFQLDTSPAAQKLELRHGMPSVTVMLTGLLKLIWASIRFLTPFWLICFLTFPQLASWSTLTATTSSRFRRLLERFFLVMLLILAAAVLLFGVTHFKDRWMQPFLFLTPLYVFVRLQGIGVAPSRLRLYAGVLGVFGLVFLAMPATQAWVGPWFGMYSRLHVPFEALAHQLEAAGFRRGMILAENTFIGGNLRLTFPHARVLTPELTTGLQGIARETGQCLVVWDGNNRQPLPEPLQQFLEKELQAQLPRGYVPGYAEAGLRHSHERVFRLGFLLLPAGLGKCR
jgi:lipopolysaccharide core galacturonosyltransferase RgtB